jgi:hypothetical protein
VSLAHREKLRFKAAAGKEAIPSLRQFLISALVAMSIAFSRNSKP